MIDTIFMSIKFPNSIFTIDSHTAGMPTRLVLGGLPKIRGDSVAQKRDYVKSEMDYIRKFLCNEPRGHHGMFCAILTESTADKADFGVIWLCDDGYPDMCGHATIGVATVLIETGMVQVKEPSLELTLEVPAGLIRVKAEVKDRKVKSASFVNVPSFLYKKDLSIAVPDYGEVRGDVAFGGGWMFYVNVEEIGTKVRPENIGELVKAGTAIKTKFNDNFELVHPTNPNISKKLSAVYFVDSPTKKYANEKNAVILGRLFDRSPCGVGTSGRVAILFARNKLGPKGFVNESIIGTTFRGKLIEETSVGQYPAVVPEVTGSANITGFNHFVLDPDDPLGPEGFLL